MKKIMSFSLLVTSIIFVSLTSGLEFTFSCGGSGGSSSLKTVYGSETIDHLTQNIQANSEKGTLSSQMSATGSLPYDSRDISDTNGNYATVFRSVDGKAGVTKYNYDWDTNYIYDDDLGWGVSAWMTLSASKAYSILGGGRAYNAEGDYAESRAEVGDSYPSAKSYLSNYHVNPYAFTREVGTTQGADYASSTDESTFVTFADNREGDDASSVEFVGNGKITNPSDSSNAHIWGTFVNQKADSISSSGTSTVVGDATNAEGDNAEVVTTIPKGGFISKPDTSAWSWNDESYAFQDAKEVRSSSKSEIMANAFNSEGDSSETKTTVSNGKVSNPWIYSETFRSSAQTMELISKAYGKVAEISSKGLDTALGYEYEADWNDGWDRTLVPVNAGEGDFVAKKTNNAQFKNVVVTTAATHDDVSISATGFGSKTALILDPRRWEFEDNEHNHNGYVIGVDIRDPLMKSLKEKGYAVTYYSDAAVSKDKVGQMDDYWVSVINTHANSYDLELSKSTDGYNPDSISPSELINNGEDLNGLWDKKNGMILLTICNTFTDTGQGSLADAASKASCSGGFTSETGIDFSRKFLIKYFDSMSKGKSAYDANNAAKAIDPFDGTKKQLELLGKPKKFKL